MAERLPILSGGRMKVVEVDDPQEAQMIRAYFGRGVDGYLRTGDPSRFDDFRNQQVAGYPLETDPDVIEDWIDRNPGFDPGELYDS